MPERRREWEEVGWRIWEQKGGRGRERRQGWGVRGSQAALSISPALYLALPFLTFHPSLYLPIWTAVFWRQEQGSSFFSVAHKAWQCPPEREPRLPGKTGRPMMSQYQKEHSKRVWQRSCDGTRGFRQGLSCGPCFCGQWLKGRFLEAPANYCCCHHFDGPQRTTLMSSGSPRPHCLWIWPHDDLCPMGQAWCTWTW